jgi:hypothetical protein
LHVRDGSGSERLPRGPVQNSVDVHPFGQPRPQHQYGPVQGKVPRSRVC